MDKILYDYYGNYIVMLLDLYFVINIVDIIYEVIGIKILLVGVEVWNKKNFIVIDDVSKFLRLYCRWKVLNFFYRLKYDVSYFFMYRYLRGLSGIGFIGGICDLKCSCVVVIFIDRILNFRVIGVVYYLGYNLGMKYDEDICKCSYSKCIMYMDSLSIFKFSNCSYNYFWFYIVKNIRCLMENMYIKDIFDRIRCGNGVVEDKE